jgi:CheY-like chemotaxis protein
LLAVVNDILDFSKIEAGKLAIDPSPFDLHECVADAARSLALRAHERGLELVTLVHADVPRLVIGDRIRLRQVLLNLVGNAIKFTHVGKVVIEVRGPAAAAGESEIHCEVRDTGIGIPRDKQSKIFDVFEQADNSSTRKYGGTGLGLAISSRLVELMGGRLWVESEPGQGSTFHFTIRAGKVDPLPRDASSAEPAICSDARVLVVPHPPVAARPLRVLLAEDSPLNQKLAVALLERRGHCVVVAADGVQAVERALAGPFDLALMDLQMPEMDGLEATETIREHERLNGGHLPIIALTAHAMVGDRARCVAAGMDAYVSKPIRDEQLFKTIESVLDRSDAEASSGATRIP